MRSRLVLCATLVLTTLPGAAASAARPTCLGERATKVGTNGADRIVGTRGRDVIVAKRGRDVVQGRGGNDLICMGPGSDQAFGGGGDDRIDLGPAPDSAIPGAGDDRVDGGRSILDDVRFFGARADVVADLTSATGEGNDRFVGIEQLFGGPGDDTLTGDAGFNILLGMEGDDIVRGLGEGDIVAGGDDDDTLDGGEGNDYLDHYFAHLEFGQAGAGVMVNLVEGTSTGQGNDTLISIEGSNGTPGDDTMIGDAGPNEFTVLNEGNDTVDAGAGDDLVDGGDGDDDLDGGEGTDMLGHLDHTVGVTIDLQQSTVEGNGTDTARNFEDIIGTFLADTITGDQGPNVILGADGDDTLDGGPGDDILWGDWDDPESDELGTDQATGGAGEDACHAETEVECETEPEPHEDGPFRVRGLLGFPALYF